METNIIQSSKVAIAILGLVVLLIWESVRPFFSFFRGKNTERSLHAIHNLIMGQINVLMISLMFLATWWWASSMTEQFNFGILSWIPPDSWWHLVGALIVLDLWMYWWHVINHKIPFFWRFHQIHHADTKMDVTTASRFHIGEIFFSSLFRIGIIFIAGISLWEVFIYETILLIIVQFHHANIGLPTKLDAVLRLLIVTPAMHKVHHSQKYPETDSNFTSLLSVWDRLFRTFRIRKNPHQIQFGLQNIPDLLANNPTKLFVLPFRRKK